MKNILKKIQKWCNNKLVTISFAMSNVEKNALSQIGESLGTDVSKFKKHTQGQLADSLINGEITQEVIEKM